MDEARPRIPHPIYEKTQIQQSIHARVSISLTLPKLFFRCDYHSRHRSLITSFISPDRTSFRTTRSQIVPQIHSVSDTDRPRSGTATQFFERDRPTTQCAADLIRLGKIKPHSMATSSSQQPRHTHLALVTPQQDPHDPHLRLQPLLSRLAHRHSP